MDDSTLILIQIKPKQIDIYKQENKLTNLMIINLAKIRFGGSGGGTSPAKPEDSFQETYTANGDYDVVPEEGHVFSGGTITVNVQPRLQTKEATPLTLAQTVSPDTGYDGLQSVTVTGVTSEIDSNITADNIKKDVTILGVTGTLESGITPTGTININANGTYDVTDKATAVVAVGGTDYRYKTGTPDTIGLAAIGWTADDIGHYGANSPHYAWENDNYKVSQKNIDLYSLADPQPSLYRNDPDVTFVPNKNILKYFGPGSGNTGFNSMPYIKSIPLFNTSAITSLNYWFKGCSSLQTIPPLDTSSATGMSSMFENCSSLQSIPQLDTNSVTNMSGMFKSCSSLQTIPPLNTSSVTNMRYMFENCSSLQTIPPLNTSSVTNISSMFSRCPNLTFIPLLDTSKVTDINSMFNGCSSLRTIPALDTSKVTDMSSMFYSCQKLESIPTLDTSSVTSTRQMLSNCSALRTVGSLDTSSVTDMSYMFQGCSSLQSVDSIDFSSVTSKPSSFFGYSDLNSLTNFIVRGKINFSWNDDYGFYRAPNLDYNSIKSILEAMNRTDNTNAKEMKFNCAILDHEGELTALVASCATKGWTITGLSIFENPLINSITPNKEHITASEINHPENITLTIDANYAWSGAGIPRSHQSYGTYIGYQYDYYDANTNEFVRPGYESQSVVGVWNPTSGSSGETIIKGNYNNHQINPHSGEYALVGISFKNATAPYIYQDYYFKVYPNGE